MRPKCSCAHIVPVRPMPVCTSSTMKKHSFSSASRSQRLQELGAEVVVAALGLDRLDDDGRDVVRVVGEGLADLVEGALLGRAPRRVSTSGVTGKRSLGLSMRGQGNFGKKSVFTGSVLVSDSV